ncbi:MAG: TIR domain-containing protein [Anaerolineae bacterium]|jgi:internalin A|nr:TIR domain-containing protein [Anaerolineae bacterium]MBT7191463.1 TIR domain-containing protein [Anaerolineae bacterium]MBT7989475.1 TIR domain-containing protein [Anaerolineae bacterium]
MSYQEAIKRIKEARAKNARRLNLSGLQLKKIPPEIRQLTSLISLSLSSNLLSVLPSEISQLSSLTSLNLSSNKFRVLPTEIGQLVNLQKLWVHDNQLNMLPPEIGKLTNLKWLDVNNNKLRALPPEIRQLTNLSSLYLKSNANLPIPPEILEKNYDPAAILSAYDDARRPLHEAKAILVGQGSVGKTSLVKRIVEDDFNEQESKTEGIKISKWKVKGEEDNKISLNIWDFGGQEIMHATHQFFLTKRSLYVLVLDSRISQEENRLEYWLKIIQSFGGDAPIILVGNKIDQQPLDIDIRGLQKKYPQIKAILETSCADGSGIEELRAKIAKEIAQLPHINDELPAKWFNIKDALAERDDNYLPYNDYIKICEEHDVSDETSQRTLIGFLHDLGTMLHFQDDLRLSELGVLNPQWVTNGVYKILNSHTLFHNKGILQLKDLSEILPADEYPRNRHPFIIDMMEKFELCFGFDGKGGRYLIPDLLPKSEPDTGDWAGSLQFQFHYPVLPSSIISRFIVRMNPFISKNTVWRAGVVLNLEGSRALVKADIEDRCIYISVQNGNPRLALSAIRNQLKSIHKTISGLEASEKVPVPGHPEVPPLDYEHLVTLENLGEETYIPEGLGERINVRDLLNGLQANAPENTEIFISYSHKDKAFVKKLAGNLSKDGNKIWWDFDALKGGDDWQKEIEKGITESRTILAVLTPDAMESEWVANEIAYAQNKGKRIIPLRLKSCDIPIGLVRKQYVDFTDKTHKAATEELLDIL